MGAIPRKKTWRSLIIRHLILGSLTFLVVEEWFGGTTHFYGASIGKMWDVWWFGVHFTVGIIAMFWIGEYLRVIIANMLQKN